jgi:DNA-binding NarL/FixJ family response regulator
MVLNSPFRSHYDWGIRFRRVIGGPVKRIDKRRGGGRTILIVDDNPEIRRAVSQAFLSDGFRICGEADNGRDAIRLCRELRPDIILLDLSMPIMNGLQAAPELRKIAPRTPIVLFTMYGNALQQDQVATLGINLVVSKYDALSEVIEKVHALLPQPPEKAEGVSA